MGKITISLAATVVDDQVSDRPPSGVKADAMEYAVHQINFDRDNKFSDIQKQVLQGRLFTKKEVKSPAFLQGIESAEIEAKKENPRLRGNVKWNL